MSENDPEKPIRYRNTRSHYKLFVHLVWHTKHNQACLTPAIRREIRRFIAEKCGEKLESALLVANGTENHLHVAVSYSPKLSIAELAQELKGGSSFHINNRTNLGKISWQDGYGAFSFGESELPRIVAYIKNQQRHHAEDVAPVDPAGPYHPPQPRA